MASYEKVLVEGHRGFAAKYPENTLASFRAAMRLPIDAFEFDVWLSRDKVPVIMHDGNARRTCGVDRDLRDMTLEEIKTLDAGRLFDPAFAGERVPTLREVLEEVKAGRPDLRLGVEIKEYTEENVDLTVALLKEYGFFDGCWFYAFNGRIIRYLKTGYGARTMGYPDFQMREFTPGTYDYYDELGLSMNLVKSELLPFYRAKGMPIHMYCADTREDAALCLREGASLITANDPLPLIEVLREKGVL